ncbi:hypothetical protein SELMODRAFT_439999 [Selaginella moellendorffii]|uniref:Tify domain-containing protein n=1 Tax=Selaginella moellendorffii TaxID=88036 RepID=D8R8S7_SELML|nr:AFP homolog 2 [Selaginella moellendorffii]EFJ32114.1 hypothetical protein SELMODRAFT_439999 [Selaginella moellendorffii]|eukprot:XP_002967515.1 AFP homolog 2 [Selaginella moellendorffii]
MEDGSRDLKKKLLIHEDESGLELSLGLSLGGGGGGGSSLEKKSSSLAAAAAAATVTGDGDSSAHEEEWISRTNNHSSQELWLRKAMIQQQQQQQSQQQSRLREFLAATATPSSSSPDVSSQQQQQQIAAAHVAAAAWRQMNHVDPAAKFMSSSGMPLSMGDLAKFLAAAKSTSSSSALAGHQPQQQQQQQAQPREDDDELDSVEQQRKFFQHQEARKKRKMLIDEQKQNKKAKDDDKPDGAENAAGGLSHMQRATSLGTFQNQTGPSAMAALATQLMRRTISDSSPVAQAQASSRDDGNPAAAAAAAAQADPATEATARALDPNATADETKQLLGMWQLGTTVDMPAAESIDPELSSLRPGTVAGQIGGTGSSPDLPWVSASGPGGKAISGVAYKLFQGQYKIVCSCHGLHMSPSDFVKHAESPDASSANGGGVKGLGDSMPVLSQVTPA